MRTRTRKPINQINVVPYIDVMLVLLVIFMVTAPLVNPGEITLPTIGSKMATPHTPLTVRVQKNGDLLFRDQQANEPFHKLTRAELLDTVRDKLAQNADQYVVIEADRDNRYETVLNLLDELKLAGVKQVGLLAQPAGVK